MKIVPQAISRKVAETGMLARKNSPTILLGAGVASMVGSTVLACRATLKLEGVLDEIETNMKKTERAKKEVEEKDRTLAHNKTASLEDQEELRLPEDMTYSDREMKQDIVVIYVRGAAKIVKLYAPAIILGGVGVACLTKSHQILKERNAALAAAYMAVDSAFKAYRERVVDRYGEETDRELRYGSEEVTIIDEETGKAHEAVVAEYGDGEPSGYARWFDEFNSNYHGPPFTNHNYVFLRNQQNWANDILRTRGHVFLNEVYSQIGLPHTTAGSIVGWVWDPHNNEHRGDNYIDFGFYDQEHGEPLGFYNGRDGAILLDFNVDGPIWDLIDKRRERQS